ncbi:MAG: beta-phosphoglucomutase [Bacteroidota bacterium]
MPLQLKYKGYIFDLDGVLVDTAKFHFQAWKNLAKKLNIELTEEHNEQLKGVSRMDSLDIILSIGGKSIEEDRKIELAAEKNDEYLALIKQVGADDALPGTYSTLERLKKEGAKICLASASKNAIPVIKSLGIEEFFDEMVDGNMVWKSKPNPEVFLTAARLLRLESKDCLVFEDAISGIEAAQAAGMSTVGIGSEDVLTEADAVVASLAELEEEHIFEVI